MCVFVCVCVPVRLQFIGCAVPVPFGYCQCYQLTPRGMCACSLYSILARTKFDLEIDVWGLRLGFRQGEATLFIHGTFHTQEQFKELYIIKCTRTQGSGRKGHKNSFKVK